MLVSLLPSSFLVSSFYKLERAALIFSASFNYPYGLLLNFFLNLFPVLYELSAGIISVTIDYGHQTGSPPYFPP